MEYTNYSLKLKQVMVAKFLNDPKNKIGRFSRENGIPSLKSPPLFEGGLQGDFL